MRRALFPSSRNCTAATATLSLAFAVTVTEPDTEPPVGAVIATVGGVVSPVPGVGAERDELHDPRSAVLGGGRRRRTPSSSRLDPRCGCRRRWNASYSRSRLG